MKRSALFLLLFFLASVTAQAQFYSTKYRLPDQNWMEIETERFRLIYPERYRAEAERSLAILEKEYTDIQNLVGGRLRSFPVILNPGNDRSNGFVAPFNFRSEVEISPIKGKALNPKSGDWLETVLPHELVHALHLSTNPSSLTSVIGLFSPDIRRSVHGAAPAGLLEGIAVQHESHGTIPGSGRGNYPYFYNQFNSILSSDNPFSMGQLVHVSDFTLPFNRHYIGGYEFIHWLHNTYGEDTMKEAIKFHYKYPMLGFGLALRFKAGKYPNSLYDEFTEEKKTEEEERLSGLAPEAGLAASQIPFNGTCRRMNRPVWTDSNTVLFYARTCNRPSGFYTYQTNKKSLQLLKEVFITEDVNYSLSDDKNELIYSRYHAHLKYDNVFKGDLHQLSIASGLSSRLTSGKRLFSPEFYNDKLLALQTDAHQQRLVQVDKSSGEILSEIQKNPQSSLIQAASNPAKEDEIALLGKINSLQAVWFEILSDSSTILNRPPDIAFNNGSVFDLSWHPDGERLLFVSDHTGTMNVYEYNRSTKRVYRLTSSIYNAFEPSYSPDGRKIAYIRQTDNEQLLFLQNVTPDIQQPIDSDLWKPDAKTSELLTRPLMNREESVDRSDWNFNPYRAGLSWVKPRLWLPSYEQEGGYNRFGLTLESTDPLSTQHYNLETSYFTERFWYDLTYRYKGFYPGFELQAFNNPSLSSVTVEQDGVRQSQTLLQQNQGVSLAVPFQLRLESNTRFSSIFLKPEFVLSRIRFSDPNAAGVNYSGFTTRQTVGLQTVLNLGIRQFTRNVQPNRGWVFFTETKIGLSDSELQVTTDQLSLATNFRKRSGFRAGLVSYLSPIPAGNQSMRISGEILTQTDFPAFNTSSIFSDSFSDIPLQGVNNSAVINTRYTIPLTYPDNGGFLIPAYLSSIYLVLYSQTAGDLNRPDFINGSRTVYGAGIRSRFRVSNMAFNIGFTVGWEPTRNNVTSRIGNF